MPREEAAADVGSVVYIIELLRWIEEEEKKLRHLEKKTGRIRNASLISEASLKTGGDLLKK
jgi:hypothetical protein